MKCDGPCGQDLPSNYLKPARAQVRQGRLMMLKTVMLCQACYRAAKMMGAIE